MTKSRVIGLAAICLAATPAVALEQGEHRLNAFGTLGVSYMGGEQDGRSYGGRGQITDSWRGDAVSKLGGQLQYGLTDKIDVTAQVIAKAEQNNWEADLEWLFLSYQATDRLVLRGGRLRSPVYMYSDSLDVGFSYPWLRLPDELYHQIQSATYEGVDGIYTHPLSFGSVSVQLAAGQSRNRKSYTMGEMFEADADNTLGGAITFQTNNYGSLRLGYEQSKVTATMETSVNIFGTQVPISETLDKQKAKFTSLGYQYDNGTWLTSNEVSKLDPGESGKKDAFYVMGGRRFGDYLAHLTYAQLDGDNGRQRSWTAGLNYNLLPNVILKGEYKRVSADRGNEGVFVMTFQEAIENQILGTPAKFDADIISVGIDFVF